MLMNMPGISSPSPEEHHFAAGAFNVTEVANFRCVVEEAEAQKAPTIIAIAVNELDFCGPEFYSYVRTRLLESPIPFVLHLDHGRTLQDILRAIQAGFTSVMFDGSELPYEENIRQTKAVVDLAHLVGVSVEGEVGTIGIMNCSDEGGVDHITYTVRRKLSISQRRPASIVWRSRSGLRMVYIRRASCRSCSWIC